VALTEPSTLVTDYLLGTLTAVLAWRLATIGSGDKAARSWAAALGATAVASFAGGTYHGFGLAIGAEASANLWKSATLAMGVASFSLATSAIFASFKGPTRGTLFVAAAAKFGVYSWWMLSHDAFAYVILEYGSTLLFLLGLLAANLLRGESGHRAYIAGGVAISVVAALIQQSGVQLHRHFNHNDLMHVVQLGAVWLLYQGGRRLRDANGGV
jgi:hypothetical protein